MSYILDALRKADAERQRGQVPDLHSPRPSQMASPAAQVVRGQPVWLLACGALALLAAVALAVWLMRPRAPTAAADAGVAAVAEPARTQQSAAPTTAPVRETTPQPQAEPARAQAPSATLAPPPLRRPPEVIAPAPPPAATAKADAATTPAPSSAPAADAVLPWAKVPPATRSALPPMAFGGSMYSTDPKARLLILGGQAVHEGDRVGGGAVVVERIGEHAAQLRFQDQRFWWPYRQ